MIRRILNISALALGLVLAGCTAIREDIQSGDSLEIKFTAQVGTFQVKATDTGLELGDQVGLFASSPVSATNVKMTWDGTALVPETRLFWTPGDERRVNFRAYYPYDPERTNEWSEHFVNADQSTHALFTASDFMAASSASNPSDGVVSFNFRHCFSKIVIHVDNQLQDLQITDIYLSNVRGRVEGEVSEYYNTIGLPGTIKTCKATTPEGEPVWAVIIPAQSSQPQLMITTADGKQFTYQSTYDIWFNQSCSYTAYVTLKENDIFTDFTSEVTEWTDNNDLEFPMPGRESWSVYGQFQGTNWDLEFPMYNCYSGTDAYYALVYVNAGDEIKLLKDGEVNYGLEEGAKWGWGGNTLVKDGASITFDKRGVYELFWYPREKSSLEIYPVGESGTWGITGTLEGLDWSGDHMLDYSSYVTMEGDVIHPLVVFDIKYREGDEFKIRFGGDWFLEYGYDSDYWESQVIETGRFYPLRKGGPNLMLPEDGMYQVYFDPYGPYIYARWTGDLPSSAIKIDGDFSDWDNLDESLVSVAYCASNPRKTALQVLKAYADDESLFVYFEYDPDQIYWERDVEHVPFHIWVNSDNNSFTGGLQSGFRDAGADYLLESFLYAGGELAYEEGGLYRWYGQDYTYDWAWDSYAYGTSSGAGNGHAYEVRLNLNNFPHNSSFSIGIDIEQSWDSVGMLPNASVTDSNPNGESVLLPVNVNGPGVVMKDVQYVSSISEVNNGEDNVVYSVAGYVTSLLSANYGNFYMADSPNAEETLYIYGTVNSQGLYPSRSSGWLSDEFGFLPGDYVRVEGVRTTYNGLVELVDVRLVSVSRLTPLGFLNTHASVDATAHELQFAFRCFGKPQISPVDAWLSYNVDYVDSDWYVLNVSVSKNEGDARRGLIDVYYDGQTISVVIDQAKETVTEHAGTLEDPYSVADITSLILDGNIPRDNVYIKGKISAILYTFSAQYGTATFWISDDGVANGISDDKKKTTDPAHDFECYSIYWLNNQPWAEGNTQIAVGDEVIVCGKTTLYNGIAETASKNAWIYSLNGVTE